MARIRGWFWNPLASWKSALPIDAPKYMNHWLRSIFSWCFVGTFVLLAATLAASKLTSHRRSQVLVRPLTTIDRHIAGFTGTDNSPLSDGVLSRLLSDSYISRTYRKPGMQADVFI